MTIEFHDVFTLAPPLLFKSRLAGAAPLNGQTVKSNVGKSFSLVKSARNPPEIGMIFTLRVVFVVFFVRILPYLRSGQGKIFIFS
jgi:hypothetical protein